MVDAFIFTNVNVYTDVCLVFSSLAKQTAISLSSTFVRIRATLLIDLHLTSFLKLAVQPTRERTNQT